MRNAIFENFNIFQCIVLKPVQTKGFQIIGVDFTTINIKIIANSSQYFVRVSSFHYRCFYFLLSLFLYIFSITINRENPIMNVKRPNYLSLK